MEQILIVIFSSFCGGLVQAVTGFGGAVIIMIFLPLILNMTAAPALSDVITMTLSFSMFWRYRKAVHYKSILIPAAVYLVTSTLAIHGSAYVDAGKLKGFFGVFLILLSVYFFAFSGKLSVKPTFFMKFGCGALAGICGGLFGISGPPASPAYCRGQTDRRYRDAPSGCRQASSYRRRSSSRWRWCRHRAAAQTS